LIQNATKIFSVRGWSLSGNCFLLVGPQAANMGKDIQWATIAFLGLLSTKGLGSSDQWKNEAWARDRNIHYTSPEM